MAASIDARMHVEKLQGPEDWGKWKWHISMVLRSYGLEDIVDGTRECVELSDGATEEQKRLFNEWQKDDAKAASVIASALSGTVAELVLTCVHAKEIWKKLQARYERSSAQRLNMLIESFFRVKRNEKEDISAHVAKLQKLFVDLNDELKKNAENVLSERILNGRILSTLGKEYDNFKDLWDTIPQKEQRLNLLIEKLCAIELRDQTSTETKAFVAPGGFKGKAGKFRKDNFDKSRKGLEQAKLKFPCNKCKKLGHWAAECPKKGINGGENSKTENGAVFHTRVMEASVNSYVGVDNWYCDSGASKHITSNKNHFASYTRFVVPEEISLGKQNVKMRAHGQGTIKIQVRRGGVWHNAEMRHVLYVPDASEHLFSVRAAARNGCITTMDCDGVVIRNRVSGKTLMTGHLGNGLYVLDMRVVRPGRTVQVSLVKASETLQVYHERFGHQNKQHIKNVLKKMNIEVAGCGEEFCDGCALGKMHRLPFKSRSNRAVAVGELIHADVNGPMDVESFGGARYYVCFKDDFSKFRRIFFLKRKNEVSNVLEQFLNEAKTNGHVVKRFRCDGGREFDNAVVAGLLADRGIEQCIGPPYTPQQNGAAERENRTIVEAARSMLCLSGLPKGLWAEACNTAAYLLNRTGKSSVDDKFPYELWYGRPVGRLNHIKIFGTKCYVHVSKIFRSKFDDKAVLGHLVGYVNDSDGFRVWVPSKGKIILSHDVRFKPEEVCDFRADDVEFEICKESNTGRELPYLPCSVNENTREGQGTVNRDSSEIKPLVEASISGGSRVVTDCEEHEESFRECSNLMEPESDAESEERVKSKRQLRKPGWMRGGEFLLYSPETAGGVADPNSFSEALRSNERDLWLEAINEELEALKQNHTWALVDRPREVRILQNRWVLRRKIANGGGVRFKARLVAKGYTQRQGVDYDETFSPVARYDTIRTLLAVAAEYGMKLEQFDIKTAFLNGILEEDVYMEQPEGYKDNTGRVCKLERSLYGLKQAPRCWNKRFMEFMTKAGFQNSNADPCLFYKASNRTRLYVAIYVDDGLVVGTDMMEIEDFLRMLQLEFSATRGSLDNFLGMKVKQNMDGSITVNQKNYTKQIIERFGMAESNAVSTPACREESDINEEMVSSAVPYREAVGCLMYLSTASRPDIAFAVGRAARTLEKPTNQSWNRVKRIFRYLRGTMDYGITYKKGEKLSVFSDADFAGDGSTRRSTTGIVAKFAHGAVSWTSRLQGVVATSTTEAEIISASEGAKELIWLKRLLSELIAVPADFIPTLYVDNAGAVKLAKNPEYHRRSKHIEVRHFYVRERFLNGELGLEHIDGGNQLADLLTKPLERVRFELLRERIGVRGGGSL